MSQCQAVLDAGLPGLLGLPLKVCAPAVHLERTFTFLDTIVSDCPPLACKQVQTLPD